LRIKSLQIYDENGYESLAGLYTVDKTTAKFTFNPSIKLSGIEAEFEGDSTIYVEGEDVNGTLVLDKSFSNLLITNVEAPPKATSLNNSYTPNREPNKVNLSLFTYPFWFDEQAGNKGIDFELTRDTPSTVNKMYFEFLHLYKPNNQMKEQINYAGNKVGVWVCINDPEGYFGEKNKGLYSPEYVNQIKQIVSEPYVTVSGTGDYIQWLMSNSDQYVLETAEYIADFTKMIGFKGINLNIERMINDYMANGVAEKYVTFLENLTRLCHERDVEIIWTTQTEMYWKVDRNTKEVIVGNANKDYGALFLNNMAYHINFDYINYMVIDFFWNQTHKNAGHFPYNAFEYFMEEIKEEDPQFQERTMIQFANYATWGYTDGWFDNSGNVIKTPEEIITYMDKALPTNEDKDNAYLYQILSKNQLDALLIGDEAGATIHKYWAEGSDDIKWDASARYNLSNGIRMHDDSLLLVLGDGIVNRRKARAVNNVGQTFIMFSDNETISKKMKWCFDKYGIKKYSIWHAYKNTVWFNADTIKYIGGSSTGTGGTGGSSTGTGGTGSEDKWFWEKIFDNPVNYVGELVIGAYFTKFILGL
jgi:hypothetical protein